MRASFLEYNPLGKSEIQSLWDSAIFVFDANVLLNLYRYSDNTSNKILQIISDLDERIWLPFQVGLEFHKNRLNVISDQKKLYKDFDKKFIDLVNEIENISKNPFFSDSVCKELNAVKAKISSEVSAKMDIYEGILNSDTILDSVNSIFDGKVGICFSEQDLKKVYADGEKRYKDKVPPGYKDLNKPENEKYGDLILWKEIINKSKTAAVDIIFISDDKKEDWWLEHQGRTISPRPELLKEFRTETAKNCHFYQPLQFLEYSIEYLGKTIKEEVLEEVKNLLPEKDERSKFLSVEISLRGKVVDYDAFTTELENAGYDVYLEMGEFADDQVHTVFVSLPNIPDLVRRLKTKYIKNIEMYNLTLVGMEITEDPIF